MNKRKSEVIFVHLNLISYRLRYLVLAESTGELVSFEFSDRLGPKFGLSETLSESLSSNEKTTSLFG